MKTYTLKMTEAQRGGVIALLRNGTFQLKGGQAKAVAELIALFAEATPDPEAEESAATTQPL